METVHEGGVIAHLGRQRTEQMADPLLVLDIDLEVADQHDRAVGPDAVLIVARKEHEQAGFEPLDGRRACGVAEQSVAFAAVMRASLPYGL